jgi:alpha-N-arabinofuranosidase
MANLAQMVNVIALIFTNADGLFLQTIYHPLRLHAEHTEEIALDPTVDCPTYDLAPADETSDWSHRVADLGPFKLLDVSATRDTDGNQLTVAVVNRDRDNAITTTIEISGGATISKTFGNEVTGPDPTTRNSFEQPKAVDVQGRRPTANGSRLEYTFPPMSVTILTLSL